MLKTKTLNQNYRRVRGRHTGSPPPRGSSVQAGILPPTDLKVEHYAAAAEAGGRAEMVEYVGGKCCLTKLLALKIEH